MDAWYSEHHHGHHGQTELLGGRLVAGFELPVRAVRAREAFVAAGLGRVHAPADAGLAPVLAVHEAGYVDFLRTAWSEWRALGHTHPALGFAWHAGFGLPQVVPAHIEGRLGYYSLDAATSIVEATWHAAYWSAMCALGAADALVRGAPAAFAICRPPGHHATARAMGGYCYLNNAAIAAERLRGRFARVGVLDIDYHHGNGTQAIFWRRDDVFFASLHADPMVDHPFFSGHAAEVGEGPGRGHTLNLPLPHGTAARAWLAALEQAIDATLERGIEAVVVSLGVDTFERDPISRFALAEADYPEIGRRLRRLARPLLFVFEGGYATEEVGRNAVAVLAGLERG
jgi:acetoin utilization deacetylase AcuC-like enzyme